MAQIDHVRQAEELFVGGCNCAQSVFLAFQDLVGLDKQTMLHLSAPFGGGVCGMRGLCGALSGLLMVMGKCTAPDDYKDTQGKSTMYRRLQGMVDQFQQENGSTKCAELLRLCKGARPDPQVRTPEYYKTRPCVRLVVSAARILEEALIEEGLVQPR